MTMTDKLSAAMRAAIDGAAADGTICGARRDTERALIRRGLAVAVLGTKNSRKGTLRNAYLGARLIRARRPAHNGDVLCETCGGVGAASCICTP